MPTLDVVRNIPLPAVETVTPLVFTAGLSQRIPLPGNTLLVQLHEDVPAGTSWTVTATADPGQLAGLIPQLEQVGGDVMDELFGTGSAEPYRTWRNLWYSNMPMPYRLGAVLLAVARRTAEIRNGGP